MFTMHKLPHNIIFHRLKNCTNGMSKYHHNNLDVSKIIKMEYNKRNFCVTDGKYYWTMEITYDEIDYDSLPFNNIYNYQKIIRKRYVNEIDIIMEFENINDKIKILKEYQVNLQNSFLQNNNDVSDKE